MEQLERDFGASPSRPAATALDRVEQRLARLEASLARVEQLVRQVEPAVVTAVDTLDDAARRAAERGVDVDTRLDAVLRLADTLTRPETAEALERTLLLVQQAPGNLAMVTDTLDALARRADDAGIDLEERVRVLARVAERLTTPAALRAAETMVDHLEPLQRLLASGILAPGPVDVVSKAGEAMASARTQSPPAPVGAWGALRSLSDPDVQAALGFALTFARRFGSALNSDADRPALPETTEP